MASGGSIACIRHFCLECQGGSPKGVRECPDTACPLWPWRMAAAQPGAEALWRGPDAARRALREIRRQCLACAGGRREVRQCAAREACPLWRWRFGVRPRTYRAVRQRFFAPKPLSLLD
ncbi:MAG TPA: hypothetical protein H9784_07720 [Candidatus Desulfovibrio intestinavium]|uniref:Uncharacterized protein n=1 Tax=Candidatus Desulfovibrio intestinavium TaxID=2838534 RepID=A0A9D2HNS8_9BACT|nr:hypothetical protein [Candidatus Desulfovibrio intestinavium]